MTYTLQRLAAGSYDLVLDGAIVGSVVRDISADGDGRGWLAELLDDAGPEQRPSPFEAVEHRLRTLEGVAHWLGDAVVVDDTANT